MNASVRVAAEQRPTGNRDAAPSRPTKRGSWREGTVRRFGLDPDESADPLHAGQPPSPAARRFLEEGDPFEIDGDFYMVTRILASDADPQTGVLILAGFEHVDGDEGSSRRVLQLRDLEALIMDDRVDIPFIGSARRYNLDCGWANGGRTLASLGIVL